MSPSNSGTAADPMPSRYFSYLDSAHCVAPGSGKGRRAAYAHKQEVTNLFVPQRCLQERPRIHCADRTSTIAPRFWEGPGFSRAVTTAETRALAPEGTPRLV